MTAKSPRILRQVFQCPLADKVAALEAAALALLPNLFFPYVTASCNYCLRLEANLSYGAKR
jgi:hypothetical protein